MKGCLTRPEVCGQDLSPQRPHGVRPGEIRSLLSSASSTPYRVHHWPNPTRSPRAGETMPMPQVSLPVGGGWIWEAMGRFPAQ